ncbi:MAG TPA: MFS transporter [Vicinamibacteria bacterium]|nr:MFS transporter [Vicinamibacteria bacterium]
MRLLADEPWRRNQQVMVATVFVVFTGFAFVLPFMTLYVRELGVADPDAVALWAGILIGVSPLVAGLMAPVWGRLADRYGQKKMVLRALVSYVILLVLSALVRDVVQLLVLRLGVGFFGGLGPLGLAMATARVPREHTGRAVGSVQGAQILSAAFGPVAGGVLADSIGIRWTFVVTAAVCAGALALVARHYREDAPAPEARPAAARGSFGDVLRMAGVPPLLAILFLVNFVGRSFTPILPLHLQQVGVPAGRLALSTGTAISLYSVAAAISAALLGKASRRHSPRALLAASLLAGALTVLPMALVGSFPAFVVLAMALGLASGGALTLCYTMGGLMVPTGQRTLAFGFFSSAALFGGAIAPTVAGLVAQWDLRGIYYLDTVVFLALSLALLPGLAGWAVPRVPAASPPPEA